MGRKGRVGIDSAFREVDNLVVGSPAMTPNAARTEPDASNRHVPREPEDQATADPATQPAANTGVATKFSDLAAFHQSLQTRLALALAAFALTATATRPVADLLPPRSLSHGGVPFLVYAAVFTFIAGALSILMAFNTLPALQGGTVARLSSRSLPSTDDTSARLQQLFIIDITHKLERLENAYLMLLSTFVLLMNYAVVVLMFAVLEAQWPYLVANLQKTVDPSSLSAHIANTLLSLRNLHGRPPSRTSNATTANSLRCISSDRQQCCCSRS